MGIVCGIDNIVSACVTAESVFHRVWCRLLDVRQCRERVSSCLVSSSGRTSVQRACLIVFGVVFWTYVSAESVSHRVWCRLLDVRQCRERVSSCLVSSSGRTSVQRACLVVFGVVFWTYVSAESVSRRVWCRLLDVRQCRERVSSCLVSSSGRTSVQRACLIVFGVVFWTYVTVESVSHCV